MTIKENNDGVIVERELTEEEEKAYNELVEYANNPEPTMTDRINALEEALTAIILGGESDV